MLVGGIDDGLYRLGREIALDKADALAHLSLVLEQYPSWHISILLLSASISDQGAFSEDIAWRM